MGKKNILVPVGGLRVSHYQDEILTTCTASCVAVAMYDKKRKIAGLLHVVLPGLRNDYRKNSSTYYADSGVPMLLKEMEKAGAHKQEVVATLVGGAKTLKSEFNIGDKNVEKVIEKLEILGISYTEKGLRGSVYRKIEILVNDGEVRGWDIFEKGSKITFEPDRNQEEFENKLMLRLLELKPEYESLDQFLEVCFENKINVDQLKKACSRNLILTLQFINYCNHEHYGMSGKIGNIDEVVLKLGDKIVKEIASNLGVKNDMDLFLKDIGLDSTILNRNALISGIIAQFLAEKTCLEHQSCEDLFIVGFLQFTHEIIEATKDTYFNTKMDQGSRSAKSHISGITKNFNKSSDLFLTKLGFPERIIKIFNIDKYKGTQEQEIIKISIQISRIMGLFPSKADFAIRLSETNFQAIGITESFDLVFRDIFNTLTLHNYLIDLSLFDTTSIQSY